MWTLTCCTYPTYITCERAVFCVPTLCLRFSRKTRKHYAKKRWKVNDWPSQYWDMTMAETWARILHLWLHLTDLIQSFLWPSEPWTRRWQFQDLEDLEGLLLVKFWTWIILLTPCSWRLTKTNWKSSSWEIWVIGCQYCLYSASEWKFFLVL